ncbi:MAG: alpha/beta fold hydrolase [Burkholderiaceae bacterium]|nr:alpha/beta fold hydrolase [Burkholderiaceae bacterium]
MTKHLNQTIRYCTAVDGSSIAWAAIGDGPPLVRCAMANHLGEVLDNPRWAIAAGLKTIARGRRLIVYDGRGTGLSDRGFEDLSIESAVDDLMTVVDASGEASVSLFADAVGAQPAIAYTARFPARVARLVLYCGYARGLMRRNPSDQQIAQREALLAAALAGWDAPALTFRLLNPSETLPDATPALVSEAAQSMGKEMSGRVFVRFLRAQGEADVSELAGRIQVPTLIVQPTRATRIPFDEGRRLAGLIPAARLLPVDSANVVLTASDPGFDAVVATIREFLAEEEGPMDRGPFAAGLTPRERDVLELIARGLDNLQIAAHLNLSEKTIRNNITPIFDKLQVENRAQAIVKAREAGFGREGAEG